MNLKNLSKKKRLYFIILLAIMGVLAWAFITAGIITHDFKKHMASKNVDEQKAVVNGIILTETKNEVKYWEIYGESGQWDSQNGIAQLNKVIANFYKDGEVTMSLTSSKGTYNSEKHDIILYNDTYIVLKDGITLNADKLHWIDSATPIVAEGHIKIQKGKKLLSTADKIVISPSYDKFQISGNTVSKVYEE